jgi:hypothetical protein
VHHARPRGASAADAPSPSRPPALSRAHSHVLCTQAHGVAVSGSYAYVTAPLSDALVVIDISNPASPVIWGSVVSSSLMDEPNAVVVSGSFAYVAAGLSDSLVVVDISNPASPAIRGSVVSSSLMDRVRVAWSSVHLLDHVTAHRGWPQAPRHASAPSIMHASAAPLPADALSRSHSLPLT